MTRPRALALTLLLLAGCRCGLFSSAPPPPDAILARAQAQCPGAQFTNVHTHEGNRLYAYMNGAAEAYFARGFRVLATADVRRGDTQAMVELYQVDGAENAAQLFADFDDGQGQPLGAGEAGTWWAAKELEGIFHRGPFFCRLIVYGSDAPARTLLRDLATAIDGRVPR